MSVEAVLANEQPFHVEVGDVLDGLRKLPAGCVQSVVTSPPYWNLRSYLPKDHADKAHEIGSEPTPEAFVAKMVEVFAEVRRVLRDDGTLWVNLGDTYDSGTSAGRKPSANVQHGYWQAGGSMGDRRVTSADTKTGDQMLMPHRVALALQADGWLLRSTIIWAKKSPMPESLSGYRWRRCRVKVAGGQYADETHPDSYKASTTQNGKANRHCSGGEWVGGAQWQPCPGCPKCLPNNGYVLRRGSWRPTTAHEYIFLMTKSGEYFCDGDAVAEPAKQPSGVPTMTAQYKRGFLQSLSSSTLGTNQGSETRNPRSVWSLSSEPEKAKHFATFPSALPRKCLTAATSKAGCCPACGACYAPMVESERVATRSGEDTKSTGDRDAEGNRDPQRHVAVTRVTGYRPTCSCQAGEPVPCLVLDPFSGSGTTGRVAYSMGLRYIGLELSEEYAAISREKIVRPFPVKAATKVKRPSEGQRTLF